MTDQQESTDVLGAPYTARTLPLRPDDEGEVVATLVSRRAAQPTNRAVLHVHGFADYFFQTVAADWWVARGYDFYALDLRKYGRSLAATTRRRRTSPTSRPTTRTSTRPWPSSRPSTTTS